MSNSLEEFQTKYPLSLGAEKDLKKIFERQNRSANERLKSSLKKTFWDLDNTPKTILYTGAGDFADHIDTYIRSFQVYTNVFRNFIDFGHHNVGSDNPRGEYYQYFTINGEGSALTGIGIGAAAATFAGLPLGMIREWYRIKHKEDNDSLDYLDANIDALDVGGVNYSACYQEHATKKDRRNAVYNYYAKLLSRDKVVNRGRNVKKDTSKYTVLGRLRALYGDFHLSERKLLGGWVGTFLDFLGVDYDISEGKTQRPWYEITISFVSISLKRIWDYINDHSYIYWLVWFPMASIVGVTAASASVIYAPIVIGLTLGLGLLYQLPKIIKWASGHLPRVEELAKSKIQNKRQKEQKKAERDRMASELKYRYFMHVEHDINKKYLFDMGAQKPAKRLLKFTKVNELTSEEVENSALGKYLLDGEGWLQDSRVRIGLAVLIEIINGIILTAFAFWVLSAMVFSFGGAIPAMFASPLFMFLDSQVNAGIAGIGISIISGSKKLIDMISARNDHKARIHEKLNEVTKTGETVLRCYERLEKENVFLVAQTEWLRIKVLIKGRAEAGYIDLDDYNLLGRFNPDANIEDYKAKYTALKALRTKLEMHRYRTEAKDETQRILASHYDLDKINVYNHEFREKQREKPGLWTKVKRFANRLYTSLAGGQTGSLVARSLFMKGCLIAFVAGGGMAVGVTTGTLPVFISIAIVVAITYAAVKFAQYHNEREYQHREKFLENMDGNISYLKKKGKELRMLNQHLAANAEHKLNDDYFAPLGVEHAKDLLSSNSTKPKATIKQDDTSQKNMLVDENGSSAALDDHTDSAGKMEDIVHTLKFEQPRDDYKALPDFSFLGKHSKVEMKECDKARHESVPEYKLSPAAAACA